MKKNAHPSLHPVVFIDASTGDEIKTRSTVTSAETRDIDGVPHYVIKCDITSASPPFYTGNSRLLDTEGRVERFKRKYAKQQQGKKQGQGGQQQGQEQADK